jgi:hypothetical protein
MAAEETQLGDLPEACLAYTIALTSPRDFCRFAAVSPSFRAAADSDDVWQRFIPKLDRRDVLLQQPPAPNREDEARKKDAYLGLCNGGGVPVGGDGGCRMWLERASGAKCYALSAKRLSLPWDDGEYSWRWKTHPLSRFVIILHDPPPGPVFFLSNHVKLKHDILSEIIICWVSCCCQKSSGFGTPFATVGSNLLGSQIIGPGIFMISQFPLWTKNQRHEQKKKP